MWQNHKHNLFLQVVLALMIGIALGLSFHDFSLNLKPLGDGFISLIKMLIAPIVFCVVVLGIYGAQDIKKMGKVGAKTILYFEIVTSIALVFGIAVAYIFKPGAGMNIDLTALDAKDLAVYTERAEHLSSSSDFILNIIPKTIFAAFNNGDILQVLLIAIIFGISMLLIPKKFAEIVRQALEAFSEVFFKNDGSHHSFGTTRRLGFSRLYHGKVWTQLLCPTWLFGAPVLCHLHRFCDSAPRQYFKNDRLKYFQVFKLL